MSLFSRKYSFIHIFENNAGCAEHYVAPDVPHYEPETRDWYYVYSRGTAFEIQRHCGIIYAEWVYPRGIKKRFRCFS